MQINFHTLGRFSCPWPRFDSFTSSVAQLRMVSIRMPCKPRETETQSRSWRLLPSSHHHWGTILYRYLHHQGELCSSFPDVSVCLVATRIQAIPTDRKARWDLVNQWVKNVHLYHTALTLKGIVLPIIRGHYISDSRHTPKVRMPSPRGEPESGPLNLHVCNASCLIASRKLAMRRRIPQTWDWAVPVR